MPSRIDSMLSHGMGKVKEIKARLSGLVGVFATLAEQHGEVAALLERAKHSDDKFAELWPKIRRELISHEQAELREVYPALRANDTTRDLANRHETEATQLEQLIEIVDELAVRSPARREEFEQLVELVLYHAREEETDIFPRAQEALGKQRAEELKERFLAAKQQIALST